jgi:hypothetical protein
MSAEKIILTACVYDQGDILHDFIEWNLHLGIDLVLVQDLGSTDGSRALLDRLARQGRVAWFSLSERDMTIYNPGNALAELARDKYQADWIILCDADEFLCPIDADLRTILRDAESKEFSMLSVPCFNMTGPTIKHGQSAVQALTLRIDKPTRETGEQQLSGELPVPYIFIQHPPHTIVRASAYQEYGTGAHSVKGSWGQNGDIGRLRFLHYCIRGYDKFETKVRNTANWLNDNKHLQPNWGWHWRRWIRLNEAGELREEYESQFVSPVHAEELISDGICTVDETVSSWNKHRK